MTRPEASRRLEDCGFEEVDLDAYQNRVQKAMRPRHLLAAPMPAGMVSTVSTNK